jgi:site-specific DNA-methyltransferase (adenine-specific)
VDPYYADESVTLWHGNCREITEWLAADVLVTDPPYGIGWSRGERAATHNPAGHAGISGDFDTSVRDGVLVMWGDDRPALVFGSMRAAYPAGWQRMLVFRKPTIGSGLYGNRMPWLTNWEPVFALGVWPDQTPARDAVVSTRSCSASGYSGYVTRAGHPHAKPVDVMEQLIDACPPGVIADPFAGSGSTLVAARNLGRKAIGVEIDERYAEIAARRLAQDVLPLSGIGG